ncbi:MAG TPA: OmpA family protein [Pseudomonas sp.]|nr:OmpA family protein [Pseudomonas sp.]
MKLKNTLGVVIGSLVAATSFGALAQGQGAFEVEAFAKHYAPDSSINIEDGELYGVGLGYFLTDNVSLNLSHGTYRDEHADVSSPDGGDHKKIRGDLTSLDALYHWNTPGSVLRPYLGGGFAHQTIGQATRGGRDQSTYAEATGGLKLYFTDNFFAKASVDGLYNIDRADWEWMAGVGVGFNFGGGSRPAPAPAPAPAPVAEAPAPVEAAPEVVRVELDVKFDFNKAQVKPSSYGDIKNLADFMKQYPQTTTTVEGHTDSVGTDAYNQKLSERRAAAVRDVLVKQYGVSSGRVSSVGYGESRPVADNATEAGRAVNRRVEAAVEAQAK